MKKIISPEILKENNYKKFIDNFKKQNNSSYLESWQKKVYNDYGKAYFINFYLYEYYYNEQYNKNCEADLQFISIDKDNEETTFNILVFAKDKTLKQVEDFCEKMFINMGVINYEYNNEEDKNRHYSRLKKVDDYMELKEEVKQRKKKI